MRETLSHQHLEELLFAHLRRDFPTLLADHTVSEALASLRAQPLGERIIYFYVVDAEGRLLGVATLLFYFNLAGLLGDALR